MRVKRARDRECPRGLPIPTAVPSRTEETSVECRLIRHARQVTRDIRRFETFAILDTTLAVRRQVIRNSTGQSRTMYPEIRKRAMACRHDGFDGSDRSERNFTLMTELVAMRARIIKQERARDAPASAGRRRGKEKEIRGGG